MNQKSCFQVTNVYTFIGQCAYPIVAHCTGGETRQHLTKNNLPAAPWQGPVLVSLEDIGWLAKGDHQTSENTGNASPRPCFALEAPEKQIPHPDLVWYLKGAHTTAYLCASSLFFRSHFDRNVTWNVPPQKHRWLCCHPWREWCIACHALPATFAYAV